MQKQKSFWAVGWVEWRHMTGIRLFRIWKIEITKFKSDAVDCEKYRQVKGGWVEERHMTGVRLLEPPEATTAPPPPPPPPPPPAVH